MPNINANPVSEATDPMAVMKSFGVDLQNDIKTAKTDATQTADKNQAIEDTAFKGYQSSTSAIADGFEKLRKQADEIKPFEAPKPKDPTKEYGTTVAGLLGIVSFATHGSMVASLNAGAAAINAARQNNTDEYNKAFSSWKENNDLAMKKLDWENGQLKNALDMADKDYNAAAGHIKTLAAITNDRALSVALDGHGIEGASQVYNARLKGLESLDQHSKALIDMDNEKRDSELYKDWIKENPNASVDEKIEKWRAISNKYSTSAAMLTQEQNNAIFNAFKVQKEAELKRPLNPQETLDLRNKVFSKPSAITGNKRVEIQTRVDQFGHSLDKVDETLSVLNNTVLAAGAGGKARRLGEAVGNVLGSNATDMAQFRRNIEYLQTEGKRLLTNSQGRPLSSDAKKIDDIIGGLGIGDTTANTIRSLEEIRTIYQRMKQEDQTQLDGTWEPPPDNSSTPPPAGGSGSGAPSGSSATPWANDPVVRPK